MVPTVTIYRMVRHDDPSGVSGTGVVADVIEFGDRGQAVVYWRNYASIGVYASMELVRQIHGHPGTEFQVMWVT